MKERLASTVLWITIAVFVAITVRLITVDYHDLRESWETTSSQNHQSLRTLYRLHRRRVTTIADVEYIREWMTLSYVNRIFALPTDYLRNALHINDSRYPNITLRFAAKTAGVKEEVYVKSVKAAVSSYLTSHPRE